MNIQSFIFNWRNKFQSTLAIESELNKIVDQVNVINSDEKNYRAYWHNVGEDSYYSAQFFKALDLHDGKSLFFHTQGDTSYDNWDQLVNDAQYYMQKYNAGIYYPKVKNVEWQGEELTTIPSLRASDSNIKYIVNGDQTVWFIHPRVVQYFQYLDLDQCFAPNKMGWGWDIVFCFVSYKLGLPVIRDSNHTINHSPARTYHGQQARDQWIETFILLPEEVKSYIKLVHQRGDLNKVALYLNSENRN